MKITEEPQSCRDEVGTTVGLVDAVISIIRVLAPRDLSAEHVQEALADLFEDPDLQTVRGARRATHVDRQSAILLEIAAERDAQDALFGVQDLPDGTGKGFKAASDWYRMACDEAFERGEGTYMHVFMEEVYEALAESDPVKLRAELVQAVAVGVKWVEAIDRREGR